MQYIFSQFDIFVWLILFVPIIFITFYVPGFFITRYLLVKNHILRFFLSNVFGLVLWGIQGYIFGYLNLRFLSVVYCMASIGVFLFYSNEIKEEVLSMFGYFSKKNVGYIAMILFGSTAQMTAIFTSGFKISEGIKFFGNNAQDGIAHLAYIQSIMNNFPPREPGLYGTLIHNYHFWTDMVLANLAMVWHIPVIHLFFHLFPILIAVLTGIACVLLVIELGGTRKMAYWFLFLIYFASDAAYSVLLMLGKTVGFYTPAIDSGVLQFLNMPHVVAKLLFIASLITLCLWIKKKQTRWLVTSSVLFAVLFGFKIYFGIFAAIGLSCYVLFEIIKSSIKARHFKINFQLVLCYLLFIILSLAIFLPNNYGSGGFVYVYLEWPRSLLGVGSIDWREWWLRRQVYEAAHNYRNLFVLDFISVVIAFISIYGTRLLGFFITRRLAKFFGASLMIFFLPGLVVFHVLGLFTIQSSGGVNVFNFFSVSSFVLSLFAAFLLSRISFKKFGLIFLALFVILTIPRSLYEIWNGIISINSNDYRIISNNELHALEFIKRNSNSNEVVQPSPYNSWDSQTPYVSFFSGRYTYLSGVSLLSTHNVKTDERKSELEAIFQSTEIVDFQTKIKQRGITYIYLLKNPEQALRFKIDQAYLKKVYENNTAIVYKVQ